MILGALGRWNQISCLITGDVNFPRPRKLWEEDPVTPSVSLRIPVLFHTRFLRKLQGGTSSPCRRVLMALISAWFRSSSATLALASDKLSSSFRMWASAFICSGRMNPVGKWGAGPPCFPLGSPSADCLPSPSRTSLTQNHLPPTVAHRVYQHKRRDFGLAHRPSLSGSSPFYGHSGPLQTSPSKKIQRFSLRKSTSISAGVCR